MYKNLKLNNDPSVKCLPMSDHLLIDCISLEVSHDSTCVIGHVLHSWLIQYLIFVAVFFISLFFSIFFFNLCLQLQFLQNQFY